MSAQAMARSIMKTDYSVSADPRSPIGAASETMANVEPGGSFRHLLEDPSLNWNVEKRNLYDSLGNKAGKTVGLYRQDTNQFLGSAQESYEVLQNQKLLGLFQPLFDKGILEFDCAGTFNKESRIFVVGRSKSGMEPIKGDEQPTYHMLYAGHDGGTAFQSIPFSCRLMCTNMMRSLAVNADIKFIHKKGINSFVDTLQQMVLRSDESFSVINEKLKVLAEIGMAKPQDAFRQLLQLPTAADRANYSSEEDFEDALDKGKHKVRWMMQSYADEAETTPPAAIDTHYHWLNSVTRHVTHDQGIKMGNSRFQRAIAGNGSTLVTKAMQQAFAVAA